MHRDSGILVPLFLHVHKLTPPKPESMSDIDALQARIDAVSADIDKQRDVLLQEHRSALQRQLNSIRDPVARLPLEISSEIFLQCRPPPPHRSPPPPVHTAPMVFMAVCNAWSHIALSTPALWGTVPVDCLSPELLELWLARARNHPLSVYFYRPDVVFGAFEGHVEQLKHLQICGDPEIRGQSKSFGHLLPCFSSLETLTLRGARRRLDWMSQIMELLSRTPNLIECTFDSVNLFPWDAPGTNVVLPNLTCLKFGGNTGRHKGSGSDRILRYVTLPALQTLSFPFDSIPTADFLLFLRRSSPPLRKLDLGSTYKVFSFGELSQWLHFMLSLVHLEMCTRNTVANDLFAALAETPSDLLPHLQNLQIHNEPVRRIWFPPSYQTILRVLSNRCTTLTYFELTSPSQFVSTPDPHICDELRQLVAGGMDIFIGDNEGNPVFF
ncbi:hypothetical protein C8F04DRAFT_1091093 [Mycena alexandri]|uniref:F-box domain-containing protein n=1 Tax=Mycena alexandri TaxID=1745969 RepID=A0AAD6X3V0_9AGAR|nr:hypothetical protein C8F04DRAFT_1091093 [Mycena alexandri]